MDVFIRRRDVKRVKVLLKEVVVHNPQSQFPYNMLVEIAMQNKVWVGAKKVLEEFIDILPSPEAIHNLAVVHYNTGNFQKAINEFKEIAKDSELIR